MIYKVTYQSMSAFYGPSFIEAENEDQAKRIFAGSAFNRSEYGLIKVVPSSLKEMQRAQANREED